jgi:hypothetical protein
MAVTSFGSQYVTIHAVKLLSTMTLLINFSNVDRSSINCEEGSLFLLCNYQNAGRHSAHMKTGHDGRNNCMVNSVCVRLQKFAHGSEMVKTLFQNLPTGKRKP